MARLHFRLKELMAKRERETKRPCTYEVIHEATGISPNSLSTLANNKVKMVGLNTIERLLEYFECEVGELIVYE